MYRLCAMDVDGTLVDARQQVPRVNAEAIERAEAAGIRCSLATGRMWRSAAPFIRELSLTGPAILYNGCKIVDPTGKVLYDERLDPGAARAALKLAAGAGFTAFMYRDNQVLVETVDDRVIHLSEKDGVPCTPVGPPAGQLHEPPTKLLLIGPVEEAESVRSEIEEVTGGAASVIRSEPDYVEILPAGVHKGSALARLCEILEIEPAEVAAIGDNLNDVEMIRAAGLGAASANAHGDVIHSAQVVTQATNEDGAVAELIELLLSRNRVHSSGERIGRPAESNPPTV